MGKKKNINHSHRSYEPINAISKMGPLHKKESCELIYKYMLLQY